MIADVMVCMTHGRFVPCRREGCAEFSTADEDVWLVASWQRGYLGAPSWGAVLKGRQ